MRQQDFDRAMMPEGWAEQLSAQEQRDYQETTAFYQDLVETFGCEAGRRVFWWLLSRLHWLAGTYTKGAEIYKIAAEADFGKELAGYLMEADPHLAAEILTMGLHEHGRQRRREALKAIRSGAEQDG